MGKVGRIQFGWRRASACGLMLAALLGTAPTAGAQAPPAAARVIQPIVVPAVAGQPLTLARRALVAAGFQTETVPPDWPPGTTRIVERTEPPAGRRFVPGRQPVVQVFHRAAVTDGKQPAEPGTPAGKPPRTPPPDATNPAPPRTVLVPDVVGRSEALATQLLQQARLTAAFAGPPAPTGRVVAAQSPPAGARAVAGNGVKLSLALTVPALIGLDCERALAKVREHGLAGLDCQLRRALPGQALRRVFEQAPVPATRLREAQRMTAVAAQGIPVPALAGLPLPKALAQLKQAGLAGQADAGDGDREVRTHKPPAGTELAPGAVVALATQRFVRVPSVIGLASPAAQVRIRQAELQAQFDHSDHLAARRVDRQSPAPNQRVAAGSAVQLFSHVEVTVPDVLHQPLPAASATLAGRGLRAAADRSDHADDRVVRGQVPPAGQSVRERSEVRLITVRQVLVPALIDANCTQARSQAAAALLTVGDCAVLGFAAAGLIEPRVVQQSLPAGSRADEGSAISLQARVPAGPLQAAAAGGAATLLAVGAGLWWWRRAPKPTPVNAPNAPVQGDTSGQSSAPAHLPKPTLHWHLLPDTTPLLALRAADASSSIDATPSSATTDATPSATPSPATGAQIRWQWVASEPVLSLRGDEPLAGDRHDPQP